MLLEAALRRFDQESRDSENIAMLVDRKDYWLNSEYRSWVTDPDDPEVKAERERRKREKIKSPPQPILVPVAQRPPEITAALMARYREVSARYAAPKAEESKKPRLKDLIGGWQFG
ncbi:hypothetical protein HQO24_10490 [Rhodococcus fascians]|nr:hypothetical protein [Rhodococcus fascians]MBY4396891.1 hypothetical protein [Rhodococcus fascians]MBY4407370.1 hypothetical protein [Rhodococcus fascians]MBY4421501.1 hypothetical protein [Rhodococcus fascians]MBY4460746.1 hypothetical protein [Rhodococcus fascians]